MVPIANNGGKQIKRKSRKKPATIAKPQHCGLANKQATSSHNVHINDIHTK